MLKWRAILVVLLGLMTSHITFGCGLCSGNAYTGAYSTGGYNLYAFTTDLYAIVDTTYYGALPNYGSGCSTPLSGCNVCSSSTNLFGNSANPSNQLINQLLINQINQNTMQMCAVSGMCNPMNPYLPNPGSYPGIPPVIPPISGIPYSPYFPPAVTPYFPNDPYSPLNPSAPYNPYFQTYPPNVPPTSQLPYGGCDNVTVMCPQGPVTTPGSPNFNLPQFPNFNFPQWPNSGGSTSPVNPPSTVDPGFSYTPTYQGGTENVPQLPSRYQIPRGARSTH